VNNNLISLMIFAPFVGAVLQIFFPGGAGARNTRVANWIALTASLVGAFCAIAIALELQDLGPVADAAIGAAHPWIGSYAITYDVAVDGVNVLLVLLVAMIFPILIASEWNQKNGRPGFHALLLILQTAFFGTLCAQDVFVLFFFWALSALPFYFLIGIWGGKGREKAASHSIVMSSIGSAFVFGALILVYCSADPQSFSIKELVGAKLGTRMLDIGGNEFSVAPVAFILLSIGLAMRTPIWPFHGWVTEVAKEAPASVFVAFCGVSVPVTTYVFVKLCYPLFPETLGESARWIQVIGVLNLLICGVSALAQKELRMLMAYLCLSEVGLILLGVGSMNSAGMVGVSYQQLVLGLGLAGFGLFTGVIENRVGHDRFIDAEGGRALGGLVTRAPAITLFSGVLIASLLGFPGLGGFVGHSLLVIGSYSISPALVLLIGGAFLLSVYCLFNMYKMVFLGNEEQSTAGFVDLNAREKAYLLPLMIALLVCGLYPKPFIEIVRPAVLTLLSMVK
jgi:NADH-quinone oxidoreductase subunit M